MSNVQTAQLLISGGVVGLVIGALATIPMLKKKGINVGQKLTTVEKALYAVEPAIGIAKEISPLNPVVNTLESINKWGKIAAGYAQQLCHAGDISKDERAAVAEEVVCSVLKELNLDVDENRKLLIDAAIKDAVNSFGHIEHSNI